MLIRIALTAGALVLQCMCAKKHYSLSINSKRWDVGGCPPLEHQLSTWGTGIGIRTLGRLKLRIREKLKHETRGVFKLRPRAKAHQTRRRYMSMEIPPSFGTHRTNHEWRIPPLTGCPDSGKRSKLYGRRDARGRAVQTLFAPWRHERDEAALCRGRIWVWMSSRVTSRGVGVGSAS